MPKTRRTTPELLLAEDEHRCDFSPDGTRVALASLAGKARIVDLATGETVARLALPARARAAPQVRWQAFGPDGHFSFSGRGAVALASIEDGVVATIPIDAAERSSTVPHAFGPRGLYVPCGDRVLEHALSGKLARELPLAKGAGECRGIAVSPDGKTLAYKGNAPAVADRVLRVDVASRKVRALELPFSGHPADCPEDARLRYASDGTLVVWRRWLGVSFFDPSGAETGRFTWDQLQAAPDVGFGESRASGDGRILVTTSRRSERDGIPAGWPKHARDLVVYDVARKRRRFVACWVEGGHAVDEAGERLALIAYREDPKGWQKVLALEPLVKRGR